MYGSKQLILVQLAKPKDHPTPEEVKDQVDGFFFNPNSGTLFHECVGIKINVNIIGLAGILVNQAMVRNRVTVIS